MIRIEESGSHLRLIPESTPRGRIVYFHGYGFGRFESLPISSRLAWGGWEVYVPELPGHGFSPEELNPENLIAFGRAVLEEIQPDAVVGHSLGARLAIASSHPQIVAISPPYANTWERSADADAERDELLRHLRPRWVKEAKPMQGLADSLRVLEFESSRQKRALVLMAQKDLASVEAGVEAWKARAGWNVERIRHADHSSIVLARSTAERILEWLPT